MEAVPVVVVVVVMTNGGVFVIRDAEEREESDRRRYKYKCGQCKSALYILCNNKYEYDYYL